MNLDRFFITQPTLLHKHVSMIIVGCNKLAVIVHNVSTFADINFKIGWTGSIYFNIFTLTFNIQFSFIFYSSHKYSHLNQQQYHYMKSSNQLEYSY